GSAFRHFLDVVDEDDTPPDEAVHYRPVVNDLVIDVNRGAEEFESSFQALDGHVDAGAEAARIGQDDLHAHLLLRAILPREPPAAKPSQPLHQTTSPPGMPGGDVESSGKSCGQLVVLQFADLDGLLVLILADHALDRTGLAGLANVLVVFLVGRAV